MAHPTGEQITPQPALALARGEDDVGKVLVEVLEGRFRGRGSGSEPRAKGGHRRVIGARLLWRPPRR